MKKVSVVIPVYNIEKYIERCLNSILNQDYKDIEVICVNDGSKDTSLEILNRYKSIDDRIKIINKENQGVSAARNDAIDIATGDYIMFVDGDDWINKEMITTLVNELETNQADIAKCFYLRDYVYKQEIETMDLGAEKLIVSEEEKAEKIYPLFINKYILNSMWGQIIKTSILKDNNIRVNSNYIYGEDTRFNYDLYTYAKKIIFIDKPYYHYFFNDNSATTIKNPEKITRRLSDIINVHNELYEFAKTWNIYSEKIETDISNRIIREFIKRSREYFSLIDQGTSKKEIKQFIQAVVDLDIMKNSIKLNKNKKINGLDKEGEIYSKFILKNDIDLYVTYGIYFYRLKKLIKKIIKK